MIKVALEKCSGCSRCQVHCSFSHFAMVGRSGARIKVVKIEAKGIDGPVVCQQCQERYCTRCPQEAIEIGPLGEVVIDTARCTACGACETLCPIGAIELVDDMPLVCDLCGGAPHCVAACTMDAIAYAPAGDRGVSLKAFKKGSKGLAPEEKRVRFVMTRAAELRNCWNRKRSE